MPKSPLFPRTKSITAAHTDDGLTDIYLGDGTFTLTLATRVQRRPVKVINIGSGTITVASATGSVLGVSSLAGQYTSATYEWNGTNFYASASTSGANAFALNGVTAGTVTASKGVVVDSNKDIGDFRNLDVVNLDAGASGTAGSLDVFPGTAAKGKMQIAAADNAGDTTTTITNASQAAARTFTIGDPGASAAFRMNALQVVSSAGAITIKDGTVIITGGSATAATLAAPTAGTDDGKTLNIIAGTAQAHTVTQAAPGFNSAGAAGDVATFGGAIGDSLCVVAYNGAWLLKGGLRNVTIA